MPIVHLEHVVRDYGAWKKLFDSDPLGREKSGARGYRIFRPVDDDKYIVVELDFEKPDDAEAFRSALQELWGTPQARQALGGTPKVRILDAVEEREYR